MGGKRHVRGRPDDAPETVTDENGKQEISNRDISELVRADRERRVKAASGEFSEFLSEIAERHKCELVIEASFSSLGDKPKFTIGFRAVD